MSPIHSLPRFTVSETQAFASGMQDQTDLVSGKLDWYGKAQAEVGPPSTPQTVPTANGRKQPSATVCGAT